MLRWYGRREGRRRPRLIGCLIWLIAVIVILIVASLLFGGFRKGTKITGAGVSGAGLSPAVPVAAAARPASPVPG